MTPSNNVHSYETDSLLELKKDKEEIKLVYQNICGVTNKINEIEIYINDRETSLSSPKYLCFCEHFLTATSAPLFKLSGYELVAFNNRINKRRGGH